MFRRLPLWRFILVLLCSQTVVDTPQEEFHIKKDALPPRVPRMKRKEYNRRIAQR